MTMDAPFSLLTSVHQKTYLETVLRVALTESEDKKPILVYASAKALDEEPIPLPPALQVSTATALLSRISC